MTFSRRRVRQRQLGLLRMEVRITAGLLMLASSLERHGFVGLSLVELVVAHSQRRRRDIGRQLWIAQFR